jgi:hypothetical protein
MRISISRGGQHLSDDEIAYLARALRENTLKYRETHARMRKHEVQRMCGREVTDD